MQRYSRIFLSLVLCFLTIEAFAIDHIRCNLTNDGIPKKTQPGRVYTNIYTCNSSYPPSFPALQLLGKTRGNTNEISVSGSCATTPLAPGNSCQFILSANFQKTGAVNFYLEVSVGSLYYLNLPAITTTISSPTGIIWPSFNIGRAQVNSTGNGSGIFIANAYNSSGHPITYTFKLTGAGTIIGSQQGSFILSNINTADPGSVIVSATADDASSVIGEPIPILVSDIPTKVISIYNNSPEMIYPIIEAPILDVDNWLRAQFQVPPQDINTDTFQSTRLHRVYTNPTGLQPGSSVLVAVPFYSTLVANPSGGSIPDQYIDWWNAMRIYLYDVQANFLQNAYTPDLANLDTLFSPGISCIAGCTGVLPSYNSGPGPGVNAIPANDPVQLTEYTFADVVTANGAPYPIDITHVDYDYSAVDQVYLPIAMEPYGNSQVGYTGTTVSLTNFRNALTNFVNTAPFWPTYVGSPAYTNPRVPGAYNVIIGNQSLTPNQNTTTQDFINYWSACVVNNSQNPLSADCLNVEDLFTKNYANYQVLCNDNSPVSLLNLLQHIYGWVAFTCPNQLNNDLVNTPGGNYSLAESSYQTLQYSAPQPPTNTAFNAYVQLVHNPSLLNMNVYAFSIDDAVGNMNEIGDGIIIAVGGANGLPNQQQFNPATIATINPGTPPPNSNDPIFTSYSFVCGAVNSTGTLSRGASFKIQSVAYPCEISLTDSKQTPETYTFILKASPPFTLMPKSNYIDCSNSNNVPWCNAINIDYISQHDVATSVPTP